MQRRRQLGSGREDLALSVFVVFARENAPDEVLLAGSQVTELLTLYIFRIEAVAH